MQCPETGDLVEGAVHRILTQYRESPLFIDLLRAVLRQAEEAAIAACRIPSFFDIDDAVGDQLTLLGKRMGWGRCHCVCEVEPVIGFECEGIFPGFPIAGFCEPGNWYACGVTGVSEVCIDDDEVYRGFLKARRYQMLARYDRESLNAALKHIWGEFATIMADFPGRVVMAPGRILTNADLKVLQLVPRVLPVAPGIQQRFHFAPLRVAGLGEGWGGFCEPWETPWPASDDNGAGNETGEFLLVTEDDDLIMGANDDGEEEGEGDEFAIMTGPLTRGAEWLCQVDLMPYGCPSFADLT